LKSILCLLPALLLAYAAEAATVAPHRAVYDLSLQRANEGASLQSASGRLAFEIEGSSCEGFTVNFRMATKYRPKEGEMTLIDTMTTTYEGPGGLDFRHQIQERIDGSLRDDHRVNMTRATAEAEGEGTVSSKPGEVFTVPAGTLLPMQHQLRLMALGAAGGGRDSSVIFDGSDEGKPFRAITFVGRAKPPGSLPRDASNPAAALLKGIAAWPVTVSYFPLAGDAETPEYQVSFDMYENGVASSLVLDYGEFALTGKLADLQMLEASDCP
jgi:EipB-like